MKKKAFKFISILLIILIIMSVFATSFTSVSAVTKDFPDGTFVDSVNYLSDFQNISIEAPGFAFEPKLTGKTVAGAPIISTITETADPGESIILQGSGFKNGKVYICGLDKNNKYLATQARVVKMDDNTATVIIDDIFQNGVFLVWAENSKGISKPVRVNNPVEVWTNKGKIVAGSEFSVFGRNLKIGDKTPYVFIGSTKLEVTFSNDKKITVKAPKDIKNGNYKLYIHNGTGGKYAWSTPIGISVISDPFAKGKEITVSNTSQLISAISSAASGDTVKLADGTYEISNAITINNKTLRLVGSGKSIIVSRVNADSAQASIVVQNSNVELKNITFKDAPALSGQKQNNFPSFVRMRGSADFFVADSCTFDIAHHDFCHSLACKSSDHLHGYNACSNSMYISGVEDVTVTNCNFVSDPGGFGVRHAKYANLTNNTSYGAWVVHTKKFQSQGTQFIHLYSCQNVDASANKVSAKSLAVKGEINDGDRIFNRFIVMQGSGTNAYFGENNVQTLGHTSDNSGEQFLLEDLGKAYQGSPSSINGTKMTFNDADFDQVNAFLKSIERTLVGRNIIIVKGKGIGQTRIVTGFSGKTVTVDRKWDIEPDGTSTVMITRGFRNIVINNNTIVGPTNYGYDYNATAGLQAYGAAVGLILTNNTFKNMMAGVQYTAMYHEKEANPNEPYAVFYNTRVEDNIIDNTRFGIFANFEYTHDGALVGANPPIAVSGGEIVVAMKNAIFRANTITNTKFTNNTAQANLLKGIGGDAIHLGTLAQNYTVWKYNPVRYGDWVQDTLIEGNTIKNSANAAVRLAYHQNDTVLLDNKISSSGKGDVIRNDHSALNNKIPIAKDAFKFDSSKAYTPVIININGENTDDSGKVEIVLPNDNVGGGSSVDGDSSTDGSGDTGSDDTAPNSPSDTSSKDTNADSNSGSGGGNILTIVLIAIAAAIAIAAGIVAFILIKKKKQ